MTVKLKVIDKELSREDLKKMREEAPEGEVQMSFFGPELCEVGASILQKLLEQVVATKQFNYRIDISDRIEKDGLTIEEYNNIFFAIVQTCSEAHMEEEGQFVLTPLFGTISTKEPGVYDITLNRGSYLGFRSSMAEKEREAAKGAESAEGAIFH